jgi:hypothetical protein
MSHRRRIVAALLLILLAALPAVATTDHQRSQAPVTGLWGGLLARLHSLVAQFFPHSNGPALATSVTVTSESPPAGSVYGDSGGLPDPNGHP